MSPGKYTHRIECDNGTFWSASIENGMVFFGPMYNDLGEMLFEEGVQTTTSPSVEAYYKGQTDLVITKMSTFKGNK